MIVPRLGGHGARGSPAGLSRFTPAKLAQGGAEGAEKERAPFPASLAAGLRLFDTAAGAKPDPGGRDVALAGSAGYQNPQLTCEVRTGRRDQGRFPTNRALGCLVASAD